MADVLAPGAQAERVLGEVAGVTFSVVVTDRPWELAVDSLVVSAGPAGVGRLGRALQAEFPGDLWSGTDLVDLTPETPRVVPLTEIAAQTPLTSLILACARDTSLPRDQHTGEHPGTPDAASRGTAAAVRAAADIRAGSVALSLLGGGAIGLPEAVAAEVNVRSARASVQQLAPSSLHRIVVVAVDERTLQAVRAAWARLESAGAPGGAEGRGGPSQERADPGIPALSPSANRVVAHAVALAGGGPVSSHLVLLAALAAGRGGDPGTAGGLLRALSAGREEGAVVAGLASVLRVPVEAAFAAPLPGDKPPALPILDRARAVTAQLGLRPTIHVRHLLAAALTADDLLPSAYAEALGATAESVRQLLRQQIGRLLPDEAPGRWDDVLGVVTDATVLDGSISRDLVGGEERIPPSEDHLGVGTYVSMLATVIARKDTPLPLSVGLFGEWGSGKSYFMGLLRDRVEELGRRPGDGYLQNVEQITFNAWHYADTNLWASLGNEIFEQLAGPEAPATERRAVLRAELAEKTQRARDLKAANERAEQETARLSEELDKARADTAGSAVTLIRSVAASGTLRVELDKAWKRLGVADAAEQGELLSAELGGARTDAEAFRLATRGPRGWLPAVVVAIALGALALSAFFPDDLARLLVGGGLTGLAAAISGVVVVVGRTRAGLRTLTAAATEIKQKAAEHAEEQFAGDLAELRRADARAAVITSQLTEVLQRVGELGRELAELDPGRRWYGFVTERAGSEDYRRELGLISTIRRDFEHLIALMAEWKALENPDDQHRPINRIVLYIDDLDRCSSKQVVDVLQAVHLLLALDLFVVVVGVDPRWLLHSLREQYRTAFRSSSGDGGTDGPDLPDEDAVWRTTPHDYLEKIFNIPFVLPGMTSSSFERLIRELSLGEDEGQAGPPGPEVPDVAIDGPSPTESRGADEPRPVPEDPGDVVLAPSSGSAPVADVTPEKGSEVAAMGVGARPVPRRLTERELTLLASLGPLVRSPRQAKRLLNLYRMVRSTRDLSPASEFLGSEAAPGTHQAVAVLLGLLTAHPRLLGQLLAAESQDDLPGGLCHRPPEQTWSEVVAGLTPRQSGDRWHNDVCVDLSDADRAEWATLVERVAPATARVRLPDLAAFRYWGPRVARFSFVLSPLAVQDEPGGHRSPPGSRAAAES